LSTRFFVFSFLILIGICAVFYFSWIPIPDLTKLWFIPAWLGRWTNVHDTLRTAIPFIFLGFITGCWLITTNRRLAWWLTTLLAFILIVIIAEAGQLFLPHRVFDLRDIAWGSFGALTGLLSSVLFAICFNQIRRQIRK
jgi:hypothetical protein